MEMKNVKQIRSKCETEEEDLSDILGQWGRWHMIITFGIIYINIPAAWYNLGMAFLAPNINHWCAKPTIFSNISVEEWKNISIPVEIKDGKEIYSSCKMYDNSSITENRTQILCSSWDYDHSFYESTLVEKWDLVCDRSWMASLANSLYFFGFLVSVFVAGQLSDRFGRKPIIFLCVAWTFLFGMMSALSQNFWMFAVCRFLISLGRASTFLIIFVLLIEIVGNQQRITIGFLNCLGWSIGQMTLPGLVWLFRNWFYLDLLSALSFAIVLPSWWIMPESPRWLLSQGRIDEAEVLIKKALKMNNRKVDNLRERLENIAKKIDNENKNNSKKVTFLDIMKTRNLRRISLFLYFIWIANILSYYGLSFGADNIGVNVFWFFFITGLGEIPAALLYFFIQPRIGRRYTQIVAMAVTGIACLSAIAVSKDLHIPLNILTIISKFSLSVSFTSMYLLSSEIYPTVVRNVGLGSCSMMGRIGAIAAPFMKEAANMVHYSLPLALFGIMSLIGSVLVLFLPETNNSNLTDTIAQGELVGSHTLHVLPRKTSESERSRSKYSFQNN